MSYREWAEEYGTVTKDQIEKFREVSAWVIPSDIKESHLSWILQDIYHSARFAFRYALKAFNNWEV
jgi:hypothetical protein